VSRIDFDETGEVTSGVAGPNPDPAYLAAWRDYARRRRALVASMVWLPAIVILAPRFGVHLPEPLLVAAGVGWLALFAITNYRHSSFRCPRCGRSFFIGLVSNAFASRCVNCKLPKWAQRDPSFDVDRNLD